MSRQQLRSYNEELSSNLKKEKLLRLSLQSITYKVNSVVSEAKDLVSRVSLLYNELIISWSSLVSNGFNPQFLQKVPTLRVDATLNAIVVNVDSPLEDIFSKQLEKFISLKKEFGEKIVKYYEVLAYLILKLKNITRQSRFKNYLKNTRNPFLKIEIRLLKEKLEGEEREAKRRKFNLAL